MKIYFAPLEGITGFLFRNAFYKNFYGVDVFYAPFISPGQEQKMTPRERKDICPENNPGIPLVPQLLTNNAQYFLHAAKELKQMGYREVNLNLGCPSGTVVAKNKGSGLLRDTIKLDRFLYEIFEKTELEISVKTRLGLTDVSEFEEILHIFNRYRMKELIIHPRLQKEMYRGTPNMEIFTWALSESTNPVCYNGDITTIVEYGKIKEKYQSLDRVMIGRGFLSNPFLAEEIRKTEEIYKTGEICEIEEIQKAERKERLRCFHRDLYDAYRQEMSGEKNVLFKMKELWLYLHILFTDGEKYFRKIKKAQRLSEYDVLVGKLFSHEEVKLPV